MDAEEERIAKLMDHFLRTVESMSTFASALKKLKECKTLVTLTKAEADSIILGFKLMTDREKK